MVFIPRMKTDEVSNSLKISVSVVYVLPMKTDKLKNRYSSGYGKFSAYG